MTINLANFNEVHVPIYLLEEERLRNNLSLIRSVAERADVEIILAFKAYALWKTFPRYVPRCARRHLPHSRNDNDNGNLLYRRATDQVTDRL